MNFVKVSSFRKAQIILRINAFLLFLFIIITPHLIKEGVWGMSESMVEGIFLAIEIGVLVKLFKVYDFYSVKSERKVTQLSSELEEQKELSVDTLKYLGRVNVQVSIIKQLVKKFKAPAEKSRLNSTINEMLQVISGLINNDKVSLRIVDLNNQKTINEIAITDNSKIKKEIKKISNKNLYRKNYSIKNNNLHIIASDHDNFSLKTFVIIAKDSNHKINDEQFDLVQDIVNQCEIVYLLFNSQYHK